MVEMTPYDLTKGRITFRLNEYSHENNEKIFEIYNLILDYLIYKI